METGGPSAGRPGQSQCRGTLRAQQTRPASHSGSPRDPGPLSGRPAVLALAVEAGQSPHFPVPGPLPPLQPPCQAAVQRAPGPP